MSLFNNNLHFFREFFPQTYKHVLDLNRFDIKAYSHLYHLLL